MGLETLTELLGLPGYFVKEININADKIFLTVERQGNTVCPQCGQECLEAPKDNRVQVVEDLSAFGRRCYIRLWKFRIECECGYRGTASMLREYSAYRSIPYIVSTRKALNRSYRSRNR